MATFVLPSKVSPQGVKHVRSLLEMDKEFDPRVSTRCPDVKRVASCALLGAYDFMRVLKAADAREAAKVALIANSYGAASTQTLTAIPFTEFKGIVEELSGIPQRGPSVRPCI